MYRVIVPAFAFATGRIRQPPGGSGDAQAGSGRDEARPGKCAGFAAVGSAHQLVNETAGDVMLLEFGNHGLAGLTPYPTVALVPVMNEMAQCCCGHRDGSPFDNNGEK